MRWGHCAGKLLDQWAYHNGVELDFSRPGKPTDNAYIESFNARLRAECLLPAPAVKTNQLVEKHPMAVHGDRPLNAA